MCSKLFVDLGLRFDKLVRYNMESAVLPSGANESEAGMGVGVAL